MQQHVRSYSTKSFEMFTTIVFASDRSTSPHLSLLRPRNEDSHGSGTKCQGAWEHSEVEEYRIKTSQPRPHAPSFRSKPTRPILAPPEQEPSTPLPDPPHCPTYVILCPSASYNLEAPPSVMRLTWALDWPRPIGMMTNAKTLCIFVRQEALAFSYVSCIGVSCTCCLALQA